MPLTAANSHEAGALDLALVEAREDYVRRNPESRARFMAAAESMPGGNTRTSLFYDPFPLCMLRGEGCRLTDADGHEYLDFLGEFTAGIFGHSPEVLKQAIRSALDDGINLSSHNAIEGKLAERICARFPSMDLLRFTNSGTEANLMALAAALTFTGRRKILVFAGGYHGGVLTFPPGGAPVTVPHDFVVASYNDLERTLDLVKPHRGELAAILVEPMQGAGGCIPGTPEFLAGLRRLADETGAVLIFDEIQTSRLSLGGRQQLLGITPDMTTIGKFFGGGLAFGSFGGRREIMQVFDPRRPSSIGHAGTYNNNTLTMTAGLAAVEQLLTAEALDGLNARGDRFRADLNALFAAKAVPITVSGLGSLMNIHPQGAPRVANAKRSLLFFDLVKAGVYFAPRGLIALSFPIGGQEISAFLNALDRILDARRSLLV
ncbi:aspartate aminotransferase family protein [Bosea psychrotolerans]|uniref:Glutamate-1-semialdehyde 2,1-aminomutase n=1 Tax=Bosea psychrotolerans TaxID=1871628 RepID=A0A2S4M1N4_9HYPH|nr:aminotransferase class III-fold pyridoxal phosphate-dependent enzyme [Bosea psychrotolerans]POR48623.1 glutamate-1-semialdehyde 2,1-aminomutase [Bosea psychrotolerans]